MGLSLQPCKTIVFLAGIVLGLQASWSASGRAQGATARFNLEDMGYVDVTAPPYDADPTGRRDSTEAIQRAVDEARWHCRATFFPPGTYLVSDTIWCRQGVLRNRHRERTRDPAALAMGLGGSVRALPCALFGARGGTRRPVIRLAPKSPGFDDPETPKPVVRFWRGRVGDPEKEQPNAGFEQMFVNIDIAVGSGNPGAIGIQHRAAQGSGVQDCRIDARGAYAGIKGGAGSGGGHANVTVVGGQYGARLHGAQPAPTMTAFTLLRQEKAALFYGGYQTLTAVGCRIESEQAQPLIETTCWPGSKDTYGQLSLVDSVLTSSVETDGHTVGVNAGASLYLNNVYLKNIDTIAAFPLYPNEPPIPGYGEGWLWIPEYAHGIDPDLNELPFKVTMSVYLDGSRQQQKTYMDPGRTQGREPPADLQQRHLWPEPFPSWETPGACNVKAPPYRAAGDGTTDDAAALQRAIDDHHIVFLPRGVYRVSRPLDLRPNTALVGVHQSFCRIVPLAGVSGGAFEDRESPQPVVRTADVNDGSTVLAFLSISAALPGSYCLHWRTGRNAVLRSVTCRGPNEYPSKSLADDHVSPSHPAVFVSGHGGGRWYNVHADNWGSRHPSYRHFFFEGTSEPMSIYQCNPEHSASGCNLEARNVSYLSIFGLKGESPVPIARFIDCDHIRIFGYGGLAAGRSHEDAIVRFVNTRNFLAANLMDRFMRRRRHADQWHMLIDERTDGPSVEVPPLERPVLYRQGAPRATPRAP